MPGARSRGSLRGKASSLPLSRSPVHCRTLYAAVTCTGDALTPSHLPPTSIEKFIYNFVMPGVEPVAFGALGKQCTTELQVQPGYSCFVSLREGLSLYSPNL